MPRGPGSKAKVQLLRKSTFGGMSVIWSNLPRGRKESVKVANPEMGAGKPKTRAECQSLVQRVKVVLAMSKC